MRLLMLRPVAWWILHTRGFGMLGFLFLLLAGVFAPFGIPAKVHDDSFRHHAASTYGVVEAQHRPDRSATSQATVDFTVDARRYHSTEQVPTHDIIGDREQVLYDPQDPAHAELSSASLSQKSNAFNLMAACLVLFVVLTLIGFVWAAIRGPGRRASRPPVPPLMPPDPPTPMA